ncbi:MAG: hypothetical protein MR210_04640 [Erysipelotrichaceae bacterium]|nr:hypothetical protein [Erysipelotrichaceae bacterium]MDY5251672.1 hypothetical protein [Erysipelotrichaceae bacterium]
MASILHVCDADMIEFHRINGNKTINFWRPSPSNRFSNFHLGDYLFFYVRLANSKEKAIVGYGHLAKITSMSFNNMWNTYKEENGYASKKAFKEAIQRLNKDNIIPTKLTGLYLTEVAFFQSPLFLSEIGINISKRLESYCYLDKEDEQATSKVLRYAEEVGQDLWTSMFDDRGGASFKQDENIYLLKQTIIAQALVLSRKQEKKAWHLLQDRGINVVNNIKYIGYHYENDNLTLYIAIINEQNMPELMLGHALMLKAKLSKYFNVTIKFICEDDSLQLNDLI